MSRRPLALARAALVVAVLGVSVAACETTGRPDYGPPPSTAFNPGDFAWSTQPGRGAIDGSIGYRQQGQVLSCTGSVALTPDTPYTRNRFQTLYGSTERAAIPEAIVRARTVPDPNADYRAFVRSATCQNNRFTFEGLPDGSWFAIAPVSAGAERTVLMQRVMIRGGRVNVTM